MLSIMILMLAQDVTGPPGDEPEPPRTTLTRQRDCVRREGEIVVCGNAASPRLLPLPEPETQRVFGPAVVRLSPNKSIIVRTEESGNAQLQSPRVMVGWKLDF